MLPSTLWSLKSTASPSLNLSFTPDRFIKSISVTLGEPPFNGSGIYACQIQLLEVEAALIKNNGMLSTCVKSLCSSIWPAITVTNGTWFESQGARKSR
jgi:hypothetical protein